MDADAVNGSAATSATGAAVVPEPTVQGRVTGLIFPPPDIRAIVDKTAKFVAKNGRAFETRIIGERMTANFSFLRETDPYHAYYEHKVSEFIEESAAAEEEAPAASSAPAPESAPAPTATPAPVGEAASAELAAAPAESGDLVVEKQAVQDVTAKVAKKIKEKVLEPPAEEKFKIKHPQLSALDQEIMYLTAQYTALSGTAFLSGLATREQRNPQFDFLKPTHALFAYFTSLVESYALVLAKPDDQMKRYVDVDVDCKVLD